MNERRQLEILFRISRALVGKQTLDDILHQIVTLTADVVGSKICTLLLLDEAKGELEIKATQSLSPTYRGKPPVKVNHSVSGRVVQRKEPIQVTDVTRDSDYSYVPIAVEEGVRSLLSVPMMVESRVIGVLNCYTEDERVFKNAEIQLIQTVANQAAMAIEHMRVVAEEACVRLALETKKAVDKAKRILIHARRMSEEEAHRFMQKASMDRNKSLKEIAEALVLASDLGGVRSFVPD